MEEKKKEKTTLISPGPADSPAYPPPELRGPLFPAEFVEKHEREKEAARRRHQQ